MSEHYSNEKLLATMDINGDKPLIYIVCSAQRGPGKTFSFVSKLLKDYFEEDKKFVLFCRTQKMLGGVADGIMKNVLLMKYDGWRCYEKIKMKGVYSDIFIERQDGEEKETLHCGYVIPISACDQIKLVSSTFGDATQGFFDEFQPMLKREYLPNEPVLFNNIHKSIARGEGSSIRYFPIYMSSNTIDIDNPYFRVMGLNKNVQRNTKFFRGEGYVFEKAIVKGLNEEHEAYGLDRAFKYDSTITYDDNSWLMDNNSCIEKPSNWGKGYYFCTLKDGSRTYGVKRYPSVGYLYIDYMVDGKCPAVFNLTKENGDLNLPIIQNSKAMKVIRDKFYAGNLRFKNSAIKNMAIDIFL